MSAKLDANILEDWQPITIPVNGSRYEMELQDDRRSPSPIGWEVVAPKQNYNCKECNNYFTNKKELVSTQFRGVSGPAYLFNRVTNVTFGPQETRTMMTGEHVVVDVFCDKCEKKIGWKYLKAIQQDQKYKEGKVILERAFFDSTPGLDSEGFDAELLDESDIDRLDSSEIGE